MAKTKPKMGRPPGDYYRCKRTPVAIPADVRAVIAALRSAIGTAGDGWPADRRLVGAVQSALDKLGHEPGAVDGWAGHNTLNALEAFLRQRATGRPWVVPRMSDAPAAKVIGADLPRQAECDRFYGTPAMRSNRGW